MERSETRTPCVLSIAGSDSGGGAGIQADLKAFARCGVHGMTAIAALTAQSTVEVARVEPVDPAMILAQIRTVAADMPLDAVKIGMLGEAPAIEAVAQALDELPRATPVVLDPVMVAESGAELLVPEARSALVELLLPRALVVTPNVPEALALAASAPAAASAGPGGGDGDPSAGPDDAERADLGLLARRVRALGPAVVVVTGGHREATDVFFDGERTVELEGELHPDGTAHGSGCTHSSALAAHLALGCDVLEAARAARRIAGEAVRDALRDVGAGAGPVDVLGIRSRAGAAVRERGDER